MKHVSHPVLLRQVGIIKWRKGVGGGGGYFIASHKMHLITRLFHNRHEVYKNSEFRHGVCIHFRTLISKNCLKMEKITIFATMKIESTTWRFSS